jgi:hypothetical protein
MKHAAPKKPPKEGSKAEEALDALEMAKAKKAGAKAPPGDGDADSPAEEAAETPAQEAAEEAQMSPPEKLMQRMSARKSGARMI